MIQNSRRKNESKSSLSLLSSDDVNKKTLINRIQSYFYSHHLAFSSATSRISSLPFQSLSISLVVAIALSLPAGFYVAVTNLQKIVNVTDSSNTITVFLKTTATQPQIELLKEKVQITSSNIPNNIEQKLIDELVTESIKKKLPLYNIDTEKLNNINPINRFNTYKWWGKSTI